VEISALETEVEKPWNALPGQSASKKAVLDDHAARISLQDKVCELNDFGTWHNTFFCF
jgi:hypothetical protein